MIFPSYSKQKFGVTDPQYAINPNRLTEHMFCTIKKINISAGLKELWEI